MTNRGATSKVVALGALGVVVSVTKTSKPESTRSVTPSEPARGSERAPAEVGRRSLLGLCLISALGVQSWAASADAASGLEAITKGVQTAPVLQGRDAALPTLDPRLTPTLAEPEPEEETQEAPVASLPELSAARPGCPGTSLCRTCRGRQLTGVHFRARARAPPRA